MGVVTHRVPAKGFYGVVPTSFPLSQVILAQPQSKEKKESRVEPPQSKGPARAFLPTIRRRDDGIAVARKLPPVLIQGERGGGAEHTVDGEEYVPGEKSSRGQGRTGTLSI